MLIKVPRRAILPQGDIYFIMSLAPEPNEDQTVGGMARVVRTRDDDKAAIDFRAISHANQERLIRFVFECQRLALANTRGDTI
jgi:c-di-GMP-binding flagellar brake protein YcgR